MGNLYTQVSRRSDKRLEILSDLKQIFRSYPRDYERVKELRIELKALEAKRNKTDDPTSPQKKYGMFAWAQNKSESGGGD